MSNIAMSNETDLDWLARNVHVWPINAEFAVRTGIGEVLFYEHHYSHLAQVSREQWLARRAELQNKPSWEDAPEWAINLVQIDRGSWVWIDSETPKMLFGSGDKFEYSGHYGAVLGDWRDTLEQRPADMSALVVTEQVEGATWFERGEFPPVGARCEIRHQYWEADKFDQVTILSITREYLIVQYETYEQHYRPEDISFRPIRTERELAIEEMCQVAGVDGLMFGLVAGKLYDAGYRKDLK